MIPAVSGTYTVVNSPAVPLGQSYIGTIILAPIPPKPQGREGKSAAVRGIPRAPKRGWRRPVR